MLSAVLLDVRCLADLDAELPDRRCQLYVGHCGAHALILVTASGWVLRSWTHAGVAIDAPFGPVVPSQLPWAPTFPQPQPQTTTRVTRRGGGLAREAEFASGPARQGWDLRTWSAESRRSWVAMMNESVWLVHV